MSKKVRMDVCLEALSGLWLVTTLLLVLVVAVITGFSGRLVTSVKAHHLDPEEKFYRGCNHPQQSHPGTCLSPSWDCYRVCG